MSKKIGTFYNTKLAQLRLATGKSTIDMEVLTGINSNVITTTIKLWTIPTIYGTSVTMAKSNESKNG